MCESAGGPWVLPSGSWNSLAASPFWTCGIYGVGQTFVSNQVDEWRLRTLGRVLPPYEIRVGARWNNCRARVEGDLWVADRRPTKEAIGIGLIPRRE